MKEEVKEELMTLECIYGHDFANKLATDDEGSTECTITLGPSSMSSISVTIGFTLGREYPAKTPQISISSLQGLPVSYKAILKSTLEFEAEKYPGTLMMFNLITFIQDWLDDYQSTLKKTDAAKSELEKGPKDKDQAIAMASNAEKQDCPKGTPVTEATFFAWRALFETERQKDAPLEAKANAGATLKLTGRQLFESDKSLIASDMTSCTALGEEAIVIDTSLFHITELEDEQTEAASDGAFNL